MTQSAAYSWNSELVAYERPHSLTAIAKAGRLVREGPSCGQRVKLNLVDETVLTLVDLARSKDRNIAILYPAPAGDVSALLAAQLLLQSVVKRLPTPSVGVLTADVVAAARAWQELRIATGSARTPLSEALPCIRATPEGNSPFGTTKSRGVLVGDRFVKWPVDLLIVDHLAGFVTTDSSIPTVHIFADPLDPALEDIRNSGTLVWGFAPSELLSTESDGWEPKSPFSVADARLRVIQHGIQFRIDAVRHGEAERCVSRIRDDLQSIVDICGSTPSRLLTRGLRVAWQHLATLLCLPCRPHVFDQFAGLPPIAARATSTFEPELVAWSRVLPGDVGEFASVLASDIGEFRDILDSSDIFLPRIKEAAEGEHEAVCVVRSHTAKRALLHACARDTEADRFGNLCVKALRKLNREGSWNRALVVGLLPKWEWHRIDSGLAPDVAILVLGSAEVRIAESMLSSATRLRSKWCSAEIRGDAFRHLLGREPPSEENTKYCSAITVSLVEEQAAVPDPLLHLRPLASSDPLLIGEEGLEEFIAEESESGDWNATVEAVDVTTDAGQITLAAKRTVEVRQGDQIVDCEAEVLRPGMYLLIGRREGRLGLLEAMADKLQRTRPDLFTATLLVNDLRTAVRRAFRASGFSITDLHTHLSRHGFTKTYQAVRGYVAESGPLAPRDLADLQTLNVVLELNLSERRIREVFAGANRLRVFRREAGRALAAAARESTVTGERTGVDNNTGLSLADLREIVLEARIIAVTHRQELVEIAELNHLHSGEVMRRENQSDDRRETC